MLRIGATSRRDLWFGSAGFGVALSTALLAGAFGLGDDARGWMTIALVALIGIFPTLLAADGTYSVQRSARRIALLCGLLGTLTFTWLALLRSGHEAGWILPFAVGGFGGAMAGMAFVPGMVAGGLLARGAAERPAGSIGAGRWLFMLVAAIATVSSWAVVIAPHCRGYALWRELLAFDAALALACLGVAARDGAWALRVRAMLAGRDPKWHVVRGAAPPASLPHLATSLGAPQARVVLAGTCGQGAGAYRASRASMPLLVLEDAPARVAARLRLSTFVALVFALALAGAAARAPRLASPYPDVEPCLFRISPFTCCE